MIFSRVKDHVSNRNYGLMMLEFMILVFGFALSLQVNEWQNDREDRELELQYLERLEDDFSVSTEAIDNSIEQLNESLVRLESGLTILAKNRREEDDYLGLFSALQSSSLTGSFPVNFVTFEELKDTGNMRVIESTELRERLGRVWQKHLSITRISEIRNMLRGNTFPVITRYVKPLEGNKLTFDAQLVEEDPRELYVALSIIRTNLHYDLSDSEEILQLTKEALDVIREELGSRR
ncbi:MAG: hypothetical protein ACE37D_10105 [Pseudomonadales bacterium]